MENIDSHKSSDKEYFDKINPSLLAWLVFLTFGGGILSLYYARIRYLPDIEWSSSIVFLALATFVGGAFALVLGLSLFIPGYIWSEFLMLDEKLGTVFCYNPLTDELCVRTLAKYIGLPFGIVLLLNHLALLVFPCLMSCDSFKGETLLWVYGGFSAFLLILASLLMKELFKTLQSFGDIGLRAFVRNLFAKLTNPQVLFGTLTNALQFFGGQGGTKDEEKRRLFKYVFWFGLSILVSQISMVLIHLMSNRPTGMPFLFTTGFCAAGVLVSNHIVAIHYRRSLLHAILTSVVVAALLLFVADRNESLSSQVVAFFGAGEKSQQLDLVLNDEGSKLIGSLHLSATCPEEVTSNFTNEASDANKVPSKVCQVRILSRLGNEFYLDYKGRKFTLPKSVVVSRISSQQQETVETNQCYCIFDRDGPQRER